MMFYRTRDVKKNPFVFGTIVRDENFGGRKREIRELVADLTGRTDLIISSPRRYGKTSLMFRVYEVSSMLDLGVKIPHLILICGQKTEVGDLVLSRNGIAPKEGGVLCAYVDLYPITDKAGFANILTTAIAKAKAGRLEEMLQAVRDAIPPVKLTIRPGGISELEGGIEVEISGGKENIDSVLRKLYDLPEKIAKKKGKKMVVIFDEFQEIARLDGKEIESNLRSRIQLHENVSYVFMGSQRHLLDQMFDDDKRALYKSGKPFRLGRIHKDELAEFIRNRFRTGEIEIKNDVISTICNMTHCHPYYAQQLCHEIWNLCIAASSKKVKTEHVLEAKSQIMRNQDHAYTAMLNPIRGRQRSLLAAMADSEGGIFSSEFRDRHDLGAPASVARAAQYLEEKGLVEKNNGKYSISDAFFAEWLRYGQSF